MKMKLSPAEKSQNSRITSACSRIAKPLRALPTADARRYVAKEFSQLIILNRYFQSAERSFKVHSYG